MARAETPSTHEPAPRGIPVGVVRSPDGDYSFGGISAGRSRLTLVGDGIPELFEPTAKAPAAYLTTTPEGQPIVSPEPDPTPYENGGAYAVLGPQVAHVVPFYGAVPIHDRRV